MAQQLTRQGETVELLVIMDTRAPAANAHTAQLIAKGIEASDDALWLSGFVKLMGQFFGKKLDASYAHLSKLAPDEQLRSVLAMLQTFNFLPPDAGATVVGHMVRVCRANFQAALSYVPSKYDGRITLMRTQEPFFVIPPGAARGLAKAVSGAVRGRPLAALLSAPHMAYYAIKSLLWLAPSQPQSQRFMWGWEALSTMPIDALAMPGNHVTMLTEPRVEVLARELQRRLDAPGSQ